MSARRRRPAGGFGSSGSAPGTRVDRPGNADCPWDHFDSEAYWQHNYGSLHELDREIIEKLGRFLGAVTSHRPGGRGLDVGPGTNIYPLLAMLPLVDSVTLWERSPANLRWLERELRGYGSVWEPFRRALMTTSECYRQLPAPGEPLPIRVELGKASVFDLPEAGWDVGTMFFVAESITGLPEEFARATLRFVRALRPGAPFVAAFVRDSRGYTVGEERYPAVAVTEHDVAGLLDGVADQVAIHLIGSTQRFREGYDGMVLATGYRANGDRANGDRANGDRANGAHSGGRS